MFLHLVQTPKGVLHFALNIIIKVTLHMLDVGMDQYDVLHFALNIIIKVTLHMLDVGMDQYDYICNGLRAMPLLKAIFFFTCFNKSRVNSKDIEFFFFFLERVRLPSIAWIIGRDIISIHGYFWTCVMSFCLSMTEAGLGVRGQLYYWLCAVTPASNFAA